MAKVKRKMKTIPREAVGVFICVSISVRLRTWVSLNMVRLLSDGLCSQRNIRRGGSILAGADSNLSPIAQTSETHRAFGHFQPRQVTLHNKTESRAHNNGLSLLCRENEWTAGTLLLHHGLHHAVLQFYAMPLIARLIHRARISSEGKL